ncbi:MAG: shikimate dehydrogenase [Alphaproteobacteria bacterium]|nr:shikimate dehydrogenase [Alphaproteobacteria bacterium]
MAGKDTTPPKTLQAGVIGWPVNHSLSPRLHGFWLSEYGIDGSYEALAVEPEQCAEFLAGLSDQGFAGVNVTVPHKQAAAVAADVLDDNARRLGAVNTIVVQPDGALHGSNTDGFGFLENLTNGAPGWTPSDGPAVVLGAGGAARAVVAALLDAGVAEVRLANRTRERADALVGEIGGNISVAAWEKRSAVLEGAALLVNTTTLGMTGKPPLDLDLGPLPVGAVVNDIVYAPLMTPLLQAAMAHGNEVVDGIGMLLHQARPGFRAWFGVEPAVTDDLRTHVLAAVGQ